MLRSVPRSVRVGALVSGAGVLLAASGAAATPVTVQSVSWQFYQGGLALQDSKNFDSLQNHFDDLAQNTVELAVGGASFRSEASILNSAVNDVDSFLFSSFVSLRAEASVASSSPQGSAEGFAGLTMYFVQFEVTGLPHFYFGTQALEGIDGTYPHGALLAPGQYEFLYTKPFSMAARALAGPGVADIDEAALQFSFEFIPIPAPGAAMAAPLLLVALGRRRRS